VQREEAEIKAEMEVNGVDVVAWIYEAHPEAYQPGPHDKPAHVLVCFDESVQDVAKLLATVAGRMHQVEATGPTNEAEDEVARVVEKTIPHDKKYLIPPEITGGPEVYLTYVYLERAKLPGGVLELDYVHGRTLPGERAMVYMEPYPKGAIRDAAFGGFRA
jgi:hypothetical protein